MSACTQIGICLFEVLGSSWGQTFQVQKLIDLYGQMYLVKHTLSNQLKEILHRDLKEHLRKYENIYKSYEKEVRYE